ncbi:unnamed protein product [Cylindrotheca closterium]|uniref:Uncharacterized protein n=1 Tax=Cylindrotheca closterium TaxID=2856 RepID=A0AAD2FGA1_9STRA|nr:unnamed protein product [Cylindrotheca closterium]
MVANCDVCGWLAAIGGMLAFGTFGVPIKSEAARSVDIDPLVMQTYKTTMCFLTSWVVLLLGEELIFTPWGIVSGLFWVPGGVATVYAVKNAGLAIGIGVGSSFIVLVSFTWGIFVFDEYVHSRLDACFAVGCMMFGLLGMAYYSAPSVCHPTPQLLHGDCDGSEESPYHSLETDEPIVEEVHSFHDEEEAEDDEQSEDGALVEASNSVSDMVIPETHTVCCGMKVQKRTLGILAAMFCGIYGGSIMAPMKFAPPDAKGTHFLISFAIGASIVNLFLWVIRYLFLFQRHGSLSGAYGALPSFHFRKMWLPGSACGILWSIGNFFATISVQFLGEGVGYSVVQASMLVSGLWGIFYFKEIEGRETITKWFLSASITVLGILLLSYEHHEK